jgi:hypothetical protein
MLVDDNSKERLFELIDANGIDGVTQWHMERSKARQEANARLKQAVIDNPMRWGIRRVEDGGVSYQGMKTVRNMETWDVSQGKLAEWAKDKGVKLSELWQVLNGDSRSCTGKGGNVYMSYVTRWSNSRDFIDKSELWKEQAYNQHLDEQTKALVDELNRNRQLADQTLNTVPQHTELR